MSKTIRLQSIGTFKADLAGDIKPGHILLWNFGHKSTVKSIDKESAKSIWITTISEGKEYKRRFLKTRPVLIINK